MRIEHDVDLRDWHTFRLPARAAELVVIERDADWAAWRARRQAVPLPEVIVGEGSNVLFVADFPGRVVRIATRGWQVVAETATERVIEAAAGEAWAPFVAALVARGWGGLENLAAIPGTVGAAPVQNIGAYGLEVGERITAVTIWHRTSGETRTVAASELAFGYRTSWFKTGAARDWVIRSVRFALPKRAALRPHYPDLQRWLTAQGIELADLPPDAAVRAVHDAVVAVRAAKLPDPKVSGNAGSFFLNPILTADEWQRLRECAPEVPGFPLADGRWKAPAAWLIEQAGLKGAQMGGVAVDTRHALVLVNLGDGTGTDLLRLMRRIQEAVAARFGVMLQPEPTLIGWDGTRAAS